MSERDFGEVSEFASVFSARNPKPQPVVEPEPEPAPLDDDKDLTEAFRSGPKRVPPSSSSPSRYRDAFTASAEASNRSVGKKTSRRKGKHARRRVHPGILFVAGFLVGLASVTAIGFLFLGWFA
jgi:hypothetical protein